jgi:peptidyl-tRNA hydrolase
MDHKPPKLVIVVRTDLKDKSGNPIGTGKLGAQIGHASHWWMIGKVLDIDPRIALAIDLTDEELAWMKDGFSRKILVEAGSEAELEAIYQEARAAGLTAHMITDLALTTFDGPTKTVVGIGPHYGDKINPVTGRLRLLR